MGQFTSLREHLEKLNAFAAVAKAKSFSRAAYHLQMTQPSLSHSIKILEEVLETPLFLRSSRGIELTEAGHTLYKFTEELLDQVAKVESLLRLQAEEPLGRIEVGTKAPYAIHLWPKYLDSLYREFPRLQVGLHIERSNSELVRGLLARRLDVLLIPEPEPCPGVVAFEVFRDSYDFYLSPRLKAPGIRRSRGTAVVEKLAEVPLILFSSALGGGNQKLGQRIEKYRKANQRIHEVDSFEAARAMATQGLGVVVLPRMMGKISVTEKKLQPVEVRGLPSDFFPEIKACLCFHEENLKNKKLKLLLSHIKSVKTS